jgi:hypothetical protein
MPPKKNPEPSPEKKPVSREHDSHRVHPHDHSGKPEQYRTCSGQWWCLDCKTWFTGDMCC